MHIIARPALRRAMDKHPNAGGWLKRWWKVASTQRWRNLLAVRRVYPATDQVGCCLVFNVKGNQFRLICRVTYSNPWQKGTLLVKHFLTHAEYDRDTWKEDCR
jgi:mRNA interferase HigB